MLRRRQAAVDERSGLLPAALMAREAPTRNALDGARDRAESLLFQMIAIQEELDWHVYHLYGLLDESLTIPIDQVPPVRLGERAFEILMARAVESGELETEWFARHHAKRHATIPEHWPEPYRALVQRRLNVIARDRDIALIEQPEYKRRWNLPKWEELEEDALRTWLLDRLENPRYWPTNPPVLRSVARLADAVRHDVEFRQVAEIYRRRADFDLAELIEELVTKESVPFLPILRYKESGLLVAQDREEGHRLFGDKLFDQFGEVEIGAAPIDFGDLAEFDIVTHGVGETGHGPENRRIRGPVARVFEAVEEPCAEGVLFKFLPLGQVPAPLVLRLLDEGNVAVARDNGRHRVRCG